VHQGEGIAEHSKHRCVGGEGLGLTRQVGAQRALLHGTRREMIDDALRVCPRGERGRQSMVGIELHRAFQQFEGARIAAGIERQNARHRAEGEVVRARLAVRLLLGAIDLGKAQAGLDRRGDPGGEMLARRGVLADGAIRTVRPQVTAGIGLDQPQGQPRLPAPSAHHAGQAIARRSRLPGDGDAGPSQRGGELVGNQAGDLVILGACLDRLQGEGQPIAAGDKD
jgi:hypothetical protein